MRYDNSVSSRVVAVNFSGSIATRSDFGARPSEHPDIQTSVQRFLLLGYYSAHE